MMKKLIIVLLVIVVFVSAINKPREVFCEKIEGFDNTKNVILRKSKEGWRLTHITTYSSPSLAEDPFTLIVMER